MQSIIEGGSKFLDRLGIPRGPQELQSVEDFVRQAQEASLIEVRPVIEHTRPHINLGGGQRLGLGPKKQRICREASFSDGSRSITHTKTYAEIPAAELGQRNIAAHQTLLTADIQVRNLQMMVPPKVRVQLDAGLSPADFIRMWDEAREEGITPFIPVTNIVKWVKGYDGKNPQHDGFLHYLSATAIQKDKYNTAITAMRKIVDPNRHEQIKTAILGRLETIAVTTTDRVQNYAHIAQQVQQLWNQGITDQDIIDFIVLGGLGDIFQISDADQATAIITTYHNLQPAEEYREKLQSGTRLRFVAELLGGVVAKSYHTDEQGEVLNNSLLEKHLHRLVAFGQSFSILEKQGNITNAMVRYGDVVAEWLTNPVAEPMSFEDVTSVHKKLQQLTRQKKN